MTVLVVALVVAERWQRRVARALLKAVASLTFVATGALLLPLDASAGRWLLVGLVLSLLGDVALIAKGHKRLFLLGLGAFLAAHLAYAAAFVTFGMAWPHVLVAAGLLALAGALVGRRLARHVRGAMRGAVAGYVVAITAMVALAAGAHGAGARPTLLLGAALFYLSDLCVARERFVVRSTWNGTVGLPLYYAAQLLLIDGLQAAGP